MTLHTHTDVLNFLITKYNLENGRYLEIGVQHKVNFHGIDMSYKIGVDPDPEANADFVGTSDLFFSSYDRTIPFNLIFIDGSHEALQVERDFINAFNAIYQSFSRAFVVLHDTVPELEIRTLIPRATKQWNGDCYKFACKLGKFQGIDFKTFPQDHGVTVVWIDETKEGNPETPEEITWDYFQRNKARLLRFHNELPTWENNR